MDKLKIGVVIADEWEYEPFKKYAEKFSTIESTFKGNNATEFEFDSDIDIVAVECGIGKVNAALATAFLIAEKGCNMILNIGLSGAIKGVHKGDIVAGSEYIECDFDLTAIGKPLGVKPDQDYLYSSDKKLVELAKKCSIDSFHRMGTGDIFLSDKELKNKYEKAFDIYTFDMETAAIAAVCHKAEIPHLSIRKISDDCDENATEDYTTLNNKAEIHLSEVLDQLLVQISENY